MIGVNQPCPFKFSDRMKQVDEILRVVKICGLLAQAGIHLA